MTAFSRSSNSPRYLAPAISAPMSSAMIRLFGQHRRDVAVEHADGKPFHDGRLADAGLADQDRIVLGPPGQHLHRPTDLLVPADDGVDPAQAGHLDQVAAVLLQRLVLLLGVLVGHPLAAADVLEGRQHGGVVDALDAEDLLGLALDLGQGQEQVLGGDVVVLEPVGLLLRRGQDVVGGPVHAQLGAGRAGEPVQLGQQDLLEPGQLHAELLQQRVDDAVGLRGQPGQQVQGQDLGVVVLLGELLSAGHRLLSLDGQLVETHLSSPVGGPRRGRLGPRKTGAIAPAGGRRRASGKPPSDIGLRTALRRPCGGRPGRLPKRLRASAGGTGWQAARRVGGR